MADRAWSYYQSQLTSSGFLSESQGHVENQNDIYDHPGSHSTAGHPRFETYPGSDSEDIFSADGEEEEDEMDNSGNSLFGMEVGSEDDVMEYLATASDQDEEEEEDNPFVNLDGMLFIDDDIATYRQISRGRPPRRHPSYLHYRHEAPRGRIHRPEEWEQEDPPPLVEPPIAQQLANELMVVPGEDQGLFVDAVIYMILPVALHTLPLTIFILSYNLLLPYQPKERPDGDQWSFWLSAVIAALTIIGTVGHLLTREDFRASSKSLVKQKVQLAAQILSCMILVLATSIGFNPLPNETVSENQNLEVQLIISTWRHWTRKIVKSFCIGYSFLSVIEIPVSLLRMANTNPVFCQVLAFEFVAMLLPTIYIALPFLLMDFAGIMIAPEKQSICLWHFLHFLAVSWICIVIVGIMKYPEIDVQRRQGELGYRYMEFIKSLQIMLQGHVFKAYLSAFHYLLMKLIRPPIIDDFQAITEEDEYGTESWTPVLYFRQISENLPPDQWQYLCPYPITLDFWMVILFGVSHLRSIGLVIGLRHET